MATICKRKSGWQAQVRKLGYTPVSKCFDKKSDAEGWARRIESCRIYGNSALSPLSAVYLRVGRFWNTGGLPDGTWGKGTY